MIIALILVFAFICLCLWSMVKTDWGGEGWLSELFDDGEKKDAADDIEPENMLYGQESDIGNLSTEYAEEIFDENFDDVYEKM